MKGVSVLQAGSGKDLVFLHGYLASKESFYPQITYFSRFYRVTAFDFLGFGQSDPLMRPFSVSDYCDWTEEMLHKLNIVFPHVIAHSFGGRVAIKCLSRGELFDKAVLCGCAGIVKKRTLSYRVKVKTYRFVKKSHRATRKKSSVARNIKRFPPLCAKAIKKS